MEIEAEHTFFDFTGMRLSQIDKKKRGLSVCEWFVRRNGRDLKHVPFHLRTVHMVRLAVGSYPKAYLLASKKVKRDRELTLLAVKRGGFSVWKAVPAALIDESLCLAAVKGCGGLLKCIPRAFRTKAVCRAAFKAGGAKLSDVPPEHIDETFFEGVALCNVPQKYRTQGLCRAGVRRKGNYLKYVPNEMIDRQMVEEALCRNPWAFRYVPPQFHDEPAFVAAKQQVNWPVLRNRNKHDEHQKDTTNPHIAIELQPSGS